MTRKPKRTEKGVAAVADRDRFDVAVLRDSAGDRVFARGVVYHEGGQVEIIASEGTRVLARVMGSEVYRCKLVGAGKNFSGECSCPAFSDAGFCKHLVATALTANSLGSAGLEQVSSRFDKIREHLRARGVEGLIQMIVGLAERDPMLLKELELSVAAADADDTTLFAQFKKAITEATRTRGSVEYHEMRDWAQGIETVLGQLESLVENGRAAVVLQLLDHFFARMVQALDNIDDSDGAGAGTCARAREIHLAACRQAKPDPIALARDLFAREVDSDWELFHGASAAYEDVLGDTGLAEYRKLASSAWHKIKPLRATGRQAVGDPHGARFALAAILEGFAERDGDIDGIIAIRTKDLSTAYDYLGIAQLCLENARESEALKWAEEGLWQFEDDPDERLNFFASELYRRTGREEDADNLLWRTFERRPSIALYERLKSAAGADRTSLNALRDRAFVWLRARVAGPGARGWSSSAELLVRLAMTEGMLTDAWMVVDEYGCSDGLLDQLAAASEESHPARALNVYARRVERMLVLGGQFNYECAHRIIGRMGRLREGLGETTQHADYLDDLRNRHKAKRNFMKLMATTG